MLQKLFTEDNLSKYIWLIDDLDIFMKKRIRKTIFSFSLLFITSLTTLYFTNLFTTLNIIIALTITFITSYLIFKTDYWMIKSKFIQYKTSVYNSFPLWISTLEILIVTNNIPNTFKKSISTCPKPIRKDLEQFVEQIQYDPENKQYYRSFLSKYEIPEVSEIVMDMYAFNNLNKDEIVIEFTNLNKRLNKISSRIRKNRQSSSLFFIAALNSIPLFSLSIYVLLISMLMNIS